MELLADLGQWGYIGLFIGTFLAGSILPFSSEIVLAGLLAMGYNLWGCIIVATIGNSFGALTCYGVGRLGKIEWIEKYFKVSSKKLAKMQHFLDGKGLFLAFFVFIPFIGDIMAIAFGYMRTNILWTNLLMALGKLFRFIVVGYGFQGISLLFQ